MRITAQEDAKSENVTTYANQPNVFDTRSEIFRYTVPDGLQAVLYDETMFTVKLYTDVPGEIDRGSYLWLMAQRAGMEAVEEITKFEYSPFQILTIQQQMNSDYRKSVLVKFHSGQVGAKLFKPVQLSIGDSLRIWLKSPDVVDWGAGNGSQISFDLDVMRVVPLV